MMYEAGNWPRQGKLLPPFTYEALPPADIEFVPLKQTRSFTADALMQVRLAASAPCSSQLRSRSSRSS